MPMRSRNFPVAAASMIMRGSPELAFTAVRFMQIAPFSGVRR